MDFLIGHNFPKPRVILVTTNSYYNNFTRLLNHLYLLIVLHAVGGWGDGGFETPCSFPGKAKDMLSVVCLKGKAHK